MAFRPETVTTTVSQIAGYNARRRSLGVFNNGTDTVFISQDQASVSTRGWPIAFGAGVVLVKEDGDEPELPLYCQANAGSQNVRVQEGFGPPP